MNAAGAIAGMVAGIGFTGSYIIYFKFLAPELNVAEHWLWGISPEGIGTLGMVLNFAVAYAVAGATAAPPQRSLDLVERVRMP